MNAWLSSLHVLQKLKQVEFVGQEFHDEDRTNAKYEASKIWDQTEALWNFPVLEK